MVYGDKFAGGRVTLILDVDDRSDFFYSPVGAGDRRCPHVFSCEFVRVQRLVLQSKLMFDPADESRLIVKVFVVRALTQYRFPRVSVVGERMTMFGVAARLWFAVTDVWPLVIVDEPR